LGGDVGSDVKRELRKRKPKKGFGVEFGEIKKRGIPSTGERRAGGPGMEFARRDKGQKGCSRALGGGPTEGDVG